MPDPQYTVVSSEPYDVIQAEPLGSERTRQDTAGIIGVNHEQILQGLANWASKLPPQWQKPAAMLTTFPADALASLAELFSAPESVAAGAIKPVTAAMEAAGTKWNAVREVTAPIVEAGVYKRLGIDPEAMDLKTQGLRLKTARSVERQRALADDIAQYQATAADQAAIHRMGGRQPPPGLRATEWERLKNTQWQATGGQGTAPLDFTPPQDDIQAEIDAVRRLGGRQPPPGMNAAQYQRLRESSWQAKGGQGRAPLDFTPPQDDIQAEIEASRRLGARQAPPGMSRAAYQRFIETSGQAPLGQGQGPVLEFSPAQEAGTVPVQQRVQNRGLEVIRELNQAATRAQNPIAVDDWQKGFLNSLTNQAAQGRTFTRDQLVTLFRIYAQKGLGAE